MYPGWRQWYTQCLCLQDTWEYKPNVSTLWPGKVETWGWGCGVLNLSLSHLLPVQPTQYCLLYGSVWAMWQLWQIEADSYRSVSRKLHWWGFLQSVDELSPQRTGDKHKGQHICLCERVPDFSKKYQKHNFLAKVQGSHYKELKANLLQGQVLITLDFSENYTILRQVSTQFNNFNRF